MYRPKTARTLVNDKYFALDQVYTLEDLGLFLAPDDTIRLIKYPEMRYTYKIVGASGVITSAMALAYNDALWFALTRILSVEISKRMSAKGMTRVLLPHGCERVTPHVPIYTSTDYHEKRTLVAVFPNGGELGVWTGRLMSLETVRLGSLQKFVDLFSSDDRGVVIGNPSQIYWHVGLTEPLSFHQFGCTGRNPIRKANRIRMNETPEQHIFYVLSQIVEKGSSAEKISIVASGPSANAVLSYLNQNWSTMRHRVACIIGIAAVLSESDITDEDLSDFMTHGYYNFTASDSPLNTPELTRSLGVNLSGGHDSPEYLPVTCLDSCLAHVQAAEIKPSSTTGITCETN